MSDRDIHTLRFLFRSEYPEEGQTWEQLCEEKWKEEDMSETEQKYYLVILRNGARFKVNEFGLSEIKNAMRGAANLDVPIDGYFCTWSDLVVRLADISAIVAPENIIA